MKYLAYGVLWAVVAFSMSRLERKHKYRARYQGDGGETNFLLDGVGVIFGLFALFLIGLGGWYVIFDR